MTDTLESTPRSATPTQRQALDQGPRRSRRPLFRLRDFARAMLLSGSTALLLAASHPPLDQAPLAWVALVPMVLLVTSSIGGLEACLAAWMGGFVFHLCGTGWLADAGDSLAQLRWILLAELISLYWVGVVLCVRRLLRSRVPFMVAFPLVWTAMEFLRAQFGLIFSQSGYPWLQLGHTQIDWPAVAQLADLGGVFAITALVAMVNAAVGEALHLLVSRRWTMAGIGVALAATATIVGLSVVYGESRLRSLEDRAGPRVGLIPDKFDRETTLVIQDELGLAADASREIASPTKPFADVWIWPEVALPVPLVQTNDEPGTNVCGEQTHLENRAADESLAASERTLAQLGETSRALRAPLILGTVRYAGDASRVRRFNSAVAVDAGGRVLGFHDKQYLVPWSEFVPGGFLRSLATVSSEVRRDFDAGEDCHVFCLPCDGDAGRKTYLATPICYEICFPRMIRRFTANSDSSTGPLIIVNIGNENQLTGAWLPRVMLVQARFRAIESRRSVVRSVMDGYCAIIDGNGAVRESLLSKDGADLRSALVGQVPIDERFSLYGFAGEWFGTLCCCLTLGLLLLSWRNTRCDTARRLAPAQ